MRAQTCLSVHTPADTHARAFQASWQYIVDRLRNQDVINQIKAHDPDDLGFVVYHSNKRGYDTLPPTDK